jgi:hypothetical protein
VTDEPTSTKEPPHDPAPDESPARPATPPSYGRSPEKRKRDQRIALIVTVLAALAWIISLAQQAKPPG